MKEYDLQVIQGQMEQVFLEINGKEFALDLALLMNIVDYCEFNEQNEPLAYALLELNHPLISASLICTEMFSKEKLDELWQSGCLQICRELIRHNGDFFFNLTDRQAMDIMALNDADMLQSLATSIHYFYQYWGKIEKRRLSKNMRDNLMTFIARHKDKDVKRLLRYNSEGIPEKFRKIYFNN